MSKPINRKCKECAKLYKNMKSARPKPECYVSGKCHRKLSYYRNHEENRDRLRRSHRYLKYCGDHCVLCNSVDSLEAHHIVPQSRGGTDDWTNLITLCRACHKTITRYYRTVGWDRELIKQGMADGQGKSY